MQEILITFMNKFGYLGIFFLIAIENIFPPIPSEVILTFSGYMTTYTNLNLWLVIIISTFGSLLGAIILYQLGKILNKDRLLKLVSGKLGKIFRLKKEDIEEAINWFLKKGQKSVFFGRFIPIIRSLISIPAGITKMHFSKFLIYTATGSLIWNSILVILGRITSKNWENIVKIFKTYTGITIFIIFILLGLFLIHFYRKKASKQQS